MAVSEVMGSAHALNGRLADELADKLGERAGDVDAGLADCRDGYAMVRDAGLLRLVVPRAAGGEGLGFLDCTKVLETIGARDVSTALGLNMHNVAIGAVAEAAGDSATRAGNGFRDWLFEQVVQHQKMFASATSESGSGAKLRGLRTVYERSDGGFVITGRKSFVSLAEVADYFVVAARRDGAEGDHEVSHFVVGRHDPGVCFGDVWPGTALRGTSTAEMVLDRAEVGRERLLMGVEGMSLFKLVREPHWMVSGYTGAYLGLAQAIFDAILSGARKRPESGSLRDEVGRLAAELRAAHALTYDACAKVDARRGSAEANAAVHASKYIVGELLLRFHAAATRVCGSRSLTRGTTLERLLRESSFCAVMPAKPAECLEYLGKTHLGVDMHNARSFDW
jgi:alkylation response protein AidB-like acyl-CoA dehydrogenase